MPKAVDKHPSSRTVGNSKFNPLKSGVSSWEDPLSAIGDSMQDFGSDIHKVFAAIGALFGLPTPLEFLTALANGVTTLVSGATDFISGVRDGVSGFFAGLTGGFLDALQIPVLDPTKILNLPNLFGDFQGVLNAAKRIRTGVPDAVGSVSDVEVTFGEVRQIKLGQVTMADLNAAPNNRPFWLSPNAWEDASFPRFALQPYTTYSGGGGTVAVDGSTAGGTATNGHTHLNGSLSVDIPAPTPTTNKPLYTIASGTLALATVCLLYTSPSPRD